MRASAQKLARQPCKSSLTARHKSLHVLMFKQDPALVHLHVRLLQVLPGLLESVFRPPMGGPGLQIYINAYNSVWLFVFVCVAYAVVCARPGAPLRPVTVHLCIAREPDAAQGASCEHSHGVACAQGSCLTGNTARLPLIADAADQQVR